MRGSVELLGQAGRFMLVLSLATAGTILLMRQAPGYFDDARELDAQHGQITRSMLDAEQSGGASVYVTTLHTFRNLLSGDLGRSRQFGVPVSDLIRERGGVTVHLLSRGIAYGWLLAFGAALPVSVLRRGGRISGIPFTVLLAVPTGAMATVCLLSNRGGPVLVLTLVLAARDFKFLERALREGWAAPHIIQARAQGLRITQLVGYFLLPNVLSRVAALATLSFITALSAVVPIEVLFDVRGIGQLAWNGAMNRDLPVLLGVTLLMATAVSLAGSMAGQLRTMETA